MIKGSKPFGEIYAEIERLSQTYRDFRVDTRKMQIIPKGKSGDRTCAIDVAFETGRQLPSGAELLELTPTQYAGRQIAEYCGIPAKYWDKLESAPDLLAQNASHWLSAEHSQRLIRTVEGTKLRAMLSTSFRRIDHIDLCSILLPEFAKPGWTIGNSILTETRLYVPAVSSILRAEVRPGDAVMAGVTVSNSEVGCGALTIEPTIFRAGTTTAIITKNSLRRAHVGRALTGEAAVEEYFSDETMALDDLALASKIQDVVRGAVNEARFYELVAQLKEAAQTPLEEDPPEIVEITARRFTLDENERAKLLRHLTVGGDLSVYGLANAVAKTADDASNEDRAFQLQRFAADTLTMVRKTVRDVLAVA